VIVPLVTANELCNAPGGNTGKESGVGIAMADGTEPRMTAVACERADACGAVRERARATSTPTMPRAHRSARMAPLPTPTTPGTGQAEG
jgi:hypothetical protein